MFEPGGDSAGDFDGLGRHPVFRLFDAAEQKELGMKLEFDGITAGYGHRPVLREVSFQMAAGQCVCVLGPNGSGKTTLLKTLLGFIQPDRGRVIFNGEAISHWPRRRFARTFGYVPQSHTPPFPFTVQDVAVMGRTCHTGFWSSPTARDYSMADQALESLGIGEFRERNFLELSGGERQLVLMARALAQEPKILVLDEPTSNLDFGNQVRVLRRINQLVEQGLSVLMTSHFPNQAFLCATKVAVLNGGRLTHWGETRAVITESALREIYGVEVRITQVPGSGDGGVSACIPLLNGNGESHAAAI
jgi:iron complex transport system ATP-binding protein